MVQWAGRSNGCASGKYMRRLEAGNFGAAKALREGVFEVRLDFGLVTGFITE